ncbi:MAG TPA: hypothetical protein VMF57_10125 [Solirubrobacteraceae bacterium]|nr:hypothetical protein [Solirubrobacteraceae bacterium]
MSISTTSGRRSSTSSIASSPLPASPTISSPLTDSVCARTLRISGSSSTSTTVIDVLRSAPDLRSSGMSGPFSN